MRRSSTAPGRSALTLVIAIAAVVATPVALHAADGPAADTSTATRLLAHRGTLQSHASIQADVVTTTMRPPTVTQGRIVIQGEQAYFRVEFLSEGMVSLIQESVVTPTMVSTIYHETKTATKIDLVRLRDSAPTAAVPNAARDTIHVFDNLAPGSTQYLGPVQDEGGTLDHFRVTNPNPDIDEGAMTIWVDPSDGIPRRMELRSPDGRLLLERKFVNIKLGVSVPDGLFALHYPEGVKVDDVTREYIEQNR